ncbi:hypothetical protein EJB05_11180, partial [Eragrostis curvula]
MELRPRRRLDPPPPRRSRRRRDHGADGDGVDRISSLLDDLLLLVLTRLRCVRAAARTSVLSRRWRGLWRLLPELYFNTSIVSSSALEAALAQVGVQKMSLLHIGPRNLCYELPMFYAAGVASLLRNAARLNPVELRVVIIDSNVKDRDIAVELPCFVRATSIYLDVYRLTLTLPAQGREFPALERLTIVNYNVINIGALISRCPHLRVLELLGCQDGSPIVVHSTTIEEIILGNGGTEVRSIDIVAPVLKKFRLSTGIHKDFTMSLLAPMLENLLWYCSFLASLMVFILLQYPSPDKQKLQQMFQFPKFSALELDLKTCGHVYGAMVINLLSSCNGIQRLKLATEQHGLMGKACTPDCPCDRSQNWRSQNSLMDLEEIEIENFKGSAHEVDFIKLLFSCSPLTKVVLRLDPNASTRTKTFREIYNYLKANPSVDYHIYRKCGKEFVHAVAELEALGRGGL